MSTAPQKKIFFVDDEPLVRDVVAANLRHAGFSVDTAETFAQASARWPAGHYDLAIIDGMLPDGDGVDLIAQARARGQTMPIMMLTARGETDAKVRGLEGGADDYLTKPFDVVELVARVRALLRRANGKPETKERYVIDAHWVRLDTGEASTNEGDITLSDKEMRLVRMFVRHDNELLSRADILEEVWGMDSFPTDRTVDNFVMRLRKLFETTPDEPRHFVTLRGRGYMFKSQP
jgi:two-component system alkaline phosphatase synthesis response regulator PhoP